MNREHRSMRGTRITLSILILLGLLGSTLLTFSDVWAESDDRPEVVEGGTNAADDASLLQAGVADITFQQLGAKSMILRPRYSQESLVFELPYRWVIRPGSASIDLAYDVISDERFAQDFFEVDPGVLEVFVDGEIVASIIPKTGLGQKAHIEIPATVFTDPNENEHSITMAYTSRVRCWIDDVDPARIVIRETSTLHLDYSVQPMRVDLADLPRPLYQSFLEPERVLIIIPDEFEIRDLEASAAIAATIGSITFGDLRVLFRRASEVTPEMLTSMSSIMIGTPTNHSLIAELYDRNLLPSVLTSDDQIRISATGQTAKPEDGVIQEIVSVSNPDRVTLILTGTTPQAVLRATQALSSLDPRLGLKGSAVIISEVDDYAQPSPAASTMLSELGLKQETLEEFGIRISQVYFYVGSNWIFDQDARLNLFYRHSATLNSGASNLSILLNGEPVASVPLINANTTTATAVIDLPPEDLKPGRNQLTFLANLEMEDPCAEMSTDAAWVRVFGTSTLELDYQVTAYGVLETLKDPLEPFYSTFDLSDIWFVLPETPSLEELDGMMQLAWLMGENTNGGGFTPRVSLAALPEENREDYHLMVLGRPTANAFLSQINPVLYQPFLEGYDTLQQVIGNVTYRLPEDFDLGWIQLVRSPWNQNRAVTVISGTTEVGMGWALDSIIAEDPYTNLTFVGPDRIESLSGEDMLRGSIAAIEAVTGQALELTEIPSTPEVSQPSATSPSDEKAPTHAEYPIATGIPRSVMIISVVLIGLGALVIAAGILLRRLRR